MKKITLDEVLDVKRGASLSGEYYAEEGKYIRTTLGNFDYPSGGFKENTSKTDLYFTGEVKDDYILKKGDIITPLTEQVSGLLGETARVPESDKYIQSGDVGLVIPNESVIDKDYCFYLVSSPGIKKQLDASAQQTKIRHTSPDAIKNCIAWIPSDKAEQKKIADLLDTINEKISLNKGICIRLQSLIKQLYEYWFVQFDFPTAEGKPYKSAGGEMKWSKELNRYIPQSWSDTTLRRYIGRITNGLNPRKNFVLGTGDNYYITIKSLIGTDIDWEACDKCDDEALGKINARSQLQIGDVIFSAIGTIGRNYYIQETPKNWNISETSFTLRPNEDVPADFFYTLLNCDEIQLQADRKAVGSTMRCLVKDTLCDIPYMDVPEKIMKAFVLEIDGMYKAIHEAQKENRKLVELRKFLYPLLMNGQVKV